MIVVELEKILHNFLNESIKKHSNYKLERSFERKLTNEELNFMNKKLKKYGYYINCYYCRHCKEFSKWKEPYHLERNNLEQQKKKV